MPPGPVQKMPWRDIAKVNCLQPPEGQSQHTALNGGPPELHLGQLRISELECREKTWQQEEAPGNGNIGPTGTSSHSFEPSLTPRPLHLGRDGSDGFDDNQSPLGLPFHCLGGDLLTSVEMAIHTNLFIKWSLDFSFLIFYNMNRLRIF